MPYFYPIISDIFHNHIKKLIIGLVFIILIAWLVHASFLYGLKDLYFGSDKDAIPITDFPPVNKINVDKLDDSSYDSILEYLVTDDYDDSPDHFRERLNH